MSPEPNSPARLLLAGVATTDSIAYAVAQRFVDGGFHAMAMARSEVSAGEPDANGRAVDVPATGRPTADQR